MQKTWAFPPQIQNLQIQSKFPQTFLSSGLFFLLIFQNKITLVCILQDRRNSVLSPRIKNAQGVLSAHWMSLVTSPSRLPARHFPSIPPAISWLLPVLHDFLWSCKSPPFILLSPIEPKLLCQKLQERLEVVKGINKKAKLRTQLLISLLLEVERCLAVSLLGS